MMMMMKLCDNVLQCDTVQYLLAIRIHYNIECSLANGRILIGQLQQANSIHFAVRHQSAYNIYMALNGVQTGLHVQTGVVPLGTTYSFSHEQCWTIFVKNSHKSVLNMIHHSTAHWDHSLLQPAQFRFSAEIVKFPKILFKTDVFLWQFIPAAHLNSS